MSELTSVVPVFCVGLSHATATVDILERVLLPDGELVDALADLAHRFDRSGSRVELALLSTCNRFEIYGSLPTDPESTGNDPAEIASAYLLERSKLPSEEIRPRIVVRRGREAADHLFRVASGVDSVVVGEAQILGQVVRAFSASQQAKVAGPVLSLLFSAALRCGRRARNETTIGQSAENISSAAIRRAERLLGGLAPVRAAVLGAGEMGRLALKSLRDRGAGSIAVANRTFRAATELAERWGATARRIGEVPNLLAESDLIVTSTSAPTPVITAAMVQAALPSRGGRPLVLIDVAVPRDIEAEVSRLPGVHLIDIDSLKTPLPDEASFQGALEAVDRIAADELAAFDRHMAEYALRPIIAELWKRAEEIKSEVLRRTRSRLDGLDEASWRSVEDLADALVHKLLHLPATRLRDVAAEGKAFEYVAALRYLFDLPPERDATS